MRPSRRGLFAGLVAISVFGAVAPGSAGSTSLRSKGAATPSGFATTPGERERIGSEIGSTFAPPSGPATGMTPDLDADEAEARLREKWPAVARHTPQAPGAGMPVERYLDERTARLPGGRGKLIVSTRPLRAAGPDGALRPVDLSLRREGDAHVPLAAPFELRLPDAADRAFHIGPDAERAVSITPTDVGPGVSRAHDVDGKLLWANTQRDTDTLRTPSIDGLETFQQIRSPEAPETFAYRLGLSPRHSARVEAGSLLIDYDGVQVLRVLPPIAQDAEGRDVPASLALDGETLTVSVAHRQPGTAYPVLLDPSWGSTYDFRTDPATGSEGFFKEESPGGPWYDTFAQEFAPRPAPDPSGLLIRPRGGRIYPENVGAKITFFAPGTTRITGAEWQHVTHLNDAHRQVLRLALYGSTSPVIFDRGSTSLGFANQDVSQVDPTASSTSAQMWLFTPPCPLLGDPGVCPRFIPTGSNTIANVGAVDFTLTDDDFPTVTPSGALRDLADSWTNTTGDQALKLAAADPGSGVESYELTGTDAAGERPITRRSTPCDPEHTTPGQGANLCPFTDEETLAFPFGQLPEGQTLFTARATDYAGNTSDDGATTQRWRVFVDRTAPALTAVGPLRDASADWTSAQGDAAVRLTATDARAGVDHYDLVAYDAQDREVFRDTNTPCQPRGADPANPCPTRASAETTVDTGTLPDGPVRFVATATDLAGNVSLAETWTVRIDRRAPVARATGELFRLDGDWTNATGPVPFEIAARDLGSGVEFVQLEAVNADGRSVLARREACAAEPCPRETTEAFEIDPASLPDGRTSFEAVAIDLAGNRSDGGTDWDTYFDHTAPEAPRAVTVRPKSTSTAEVSWERSADNSDGGGVVGYEYQVRIEGQPTTQWQATTIPLAKLGGLPPGVRVEVLVRAVDAARNVSLPAAAHGEAFPSYRAQAGRQSLEGQYQPSLTIDADDGFSTIKFDSVLRMNAEGRSTRLCFGQYNDCPNDAGFPLSPEEGEGFRLNYPASYRTREQRKLALDTTRRLYGGSQRTNPYMYTFRSRRDSDGSFVIQYWFFFSFNYYDGRGSCDECRGVGHDLHEGDWEHFDIRFDATSRPIRAQFSRHSYSRTFDWASDELERRGTHIKVYAARGDHALYERCGTFRIEQIPGYLEIFTGGFADYTCSHRSTFETPLSTPRASIGSKVLVDRFSCWQGLFGEQNPPPSRLRSAYGMSPQAPLRQSKAPGAQAVCNQASQRRGQNANGSGSSAVPPKPRLASKSGACSEWLRSSGRQNTTTIVACNSRSVYGDDAEAPSVRITDSAGRNIGDTGSPAVATIPGDDLGSLRITVTKPARLRVFVSIEEPDGSQSSATFGEIDARAEDVLRLTPRGPRRWQIVSQAGRVAGTRVISRLPKLVSGPRPEGGSRPVSVVATRNGRHLVVRWSVAAACHGCRFTIVQAAKKKTYRATRILGRLSGPTNSGFYQKKLVAPRGCRGGLRVISTVDKTSLRSSFVRVRKNCSTR